MRIMFSWSRRSPLNREASRNQIPINIGFPIASGVTGCRDELLGRFGVPAITTPETVIVDDARLQAQQWQELIGAFLGHVNGRVLPENGDATVVAEDFKPIGPKSILRLINKYLLRLK